VRRSSTPSAARTQSCARPSSRLLCDDTADDDLFGRLEQRTCSAQDDPMLGRSIDSYRLVSRLAVGGMGVVYRAERTDGLFEHEVAVKLIRAERATEGLVRRFELERRTLAALHHPCIARLYDGGSTEDGRPYLVMELVHGLPIDRFCERERLPVAERLRLFVQVCRAVHYAHQNLVVHRDLKPSNILIDEQGLPRLLDFGIARLLEHDEGMEPPAATLTVARILTPEYASPEQLAGGRVTTALDIYSLGVILYELLTGHRPFEFEAAARPTGSASSASTPRAPEHGRAQAVAGAESLAARCGSTPAGLSRRLRGDLDRIVLMALRKEPERRYASAQEFADDIERHLSGRPVLARADSLWYRGSKFVRRNRLAVAAVTAVIGALLMGVVVSRRSEERAELEAEHARIEAESFQEIADFLMDAFLPTAAAQDATWQRQARDRILPARRARAPAASQEDHIRANLLESLGQVCQRISLYEDAEGLIREALAIRERAFGRRSLEVALSLQSLGQLDYRRGDYSRAADELREALELNRTCAPGTHTDVASVANDLAACLRAGGNEIEAERLHLEALALRRE
jgi:serine/threonine-protein kinase